jgi:hypothetical protein
LAKGNEAPHANSVKLHAVLNYPQKFAKRAQITLGGVAKKKPWNLLTKAYKLTF